MFDELFFGIGLNLIAWYALMESVQAEKINDLTQHLVTFNKIPLERPFLLVLGPASYKAKQKYETEYAFKRGLEEKERYFRM